MHALATLGLGTGELLLLAAPFLFGFWLWMLLDVIKREPAANGQRLVWLLVVLLAGFVGAAIYFFARKLSRVREAEQNPPPAPRV